MKLNEVMRELRSLGSAQTRKTYARHGGRGEMFGVSYANLGKLRKRIKTDHELGRALWETANVDARVLATMIVEPERFKSAELDRWARDGADSLVTEPVAEIASQTKFAKAKADKWRKAKNEDVGRAGWGVVARLALRDPDLPDAWFAERLAEIEEGIHDALNRTKQGMNQALISIGGRSAGLRTKVLAAAKRIGKVDVDHGDTSCKTPDAKVYIEKMWAHAKSKGFKSPAEQEQGRKRKGGCAR